MRSWAPGMVAPREPRRLAGTAFPPGSQLGRSGHELLPVLRARDARRAVPVRRRRPRGAHPGRRPDGVQLALLRPRRRARHALRLPRARPVRARGGPPLQPVQAAHRSVREGDRGRRSSWDAANTLPYVPIPRTRRTPTSSATTRTPRPRSRSRWSSTSASTGRATPTRARRGTETVIYEAHVKGFTERTPRCARTCAAPTAAWRPSRRCATSRTSASPPSSCCRSTTSPTSFLTERGLDELLGLQLDRLPRAARGLRRDRLPPASRSASSRAWSRPCTARASR